MDAPNAYLKLGWLFVPRLAADLSLPDWEGGISEETIEERQAIIAIEIPRATREEKRRAAGDALHTLANEMLMTRAPWKRTVSTYCKAWLYGESPYVMLTVGQLLASNNQSAYALQAFAIVERYPECAAELETLPQLGEHDTTELMKHVQRIKALTTSA